MKNEVATLVSIPPIGAAVPRRGNRLTRWLGRMLLLVIGWRVVGQIPDRDRFVAIGAPHTSNWDGLLMAAIWLATGIDFQWMGKHTLFRWPVRGLLRWLGGIPINRTASHGVVEAMVAEFKRRQQLVLVIAPEGTRSQVNRWKSGFYHIAVGAGVPILPVVIHNDQRVIDIRPLFWPGGDVATDIPRLQQLYPLALPAPADSASE